MYATNEGQVCTTCYSFLQRRAWRMEREVDYKQGRRKCEHAVAETFHPALAERPMLVRRAFVSRHFTVLPVGDRAALIPLPGRVGWGANQRG